MPSNYYHARGKVAILLSRCDVLHHIGDTERALQDAGAALDLAKRSQLAKEQAASLMALSSVHDQLNQMEAMRQEVLAALDLYRRLGDRFGECQATGQLGIATSSLEGYATARPYYQRALDIARILDNPHNLYHCLLEMGWILIRTKEYDLARANVEEGLEMAGAAEDAAQVAFGTSSLGEIALRQGRPEEALALHQRALAIREKIGETWFQAITWSWISQDWRAVGDLAKAKDARERSLAINRVIGTHPIIAFDLTLLAEFGEIQGDLATALAQGRESVDLCLQHEVRNFLLGAKSRLSSVQFSLGNWAEAEAAAREVLSGETPREDKALAALVLGQLTLVRGDRILAFGRLQEAREMAERADKPVLAFKALGAWAELHLSLGDAPAARKALETMYALLPDLREKDAEPLLDGLAACLLACEGKTEEAGTAFDRALERVRGMGLHLEEARSRLRFGRALGRKIGCPYIQTAQALFSELGATGWAELCAQALQP